MLQASKLPIASSRAGQIDQHYGGPEGINLNRCRAQGAHDCLQFALVPPWNPPLALFFGNGRCQKVITAVCCDVRRARIECSVRGRGVAGHIPIKVAPSRLGHALAPAIDSIRVETGGHTPREIIAACMRFGANATAIGILRRARVMIMPGMSVKYTIVVQPPRL